MVSVNWEDKIQFKKDGLSKESLDDIVQALKMHPGGDVHIVLLDLMALFNKEKEHYSLRDLTLKDPICDFIRKLDGKQILDSYKTFKLLLDVKLEEDVSYNHNYYSYSCVCIFTYLFILLSATCWLLLHFSLIIHTSSHRSFF